MTKFFHFSRNNNHARNSSKRARILRFESLENRRLLSVANYNVTQENESMTTDTLSEGAILNNAVATTMESIVQHFTNEEDSSPVHSENDSSVSCLTEQSENVSNDNADEYDPYFEQFGVYINGEKYICIWDLQYRPMLCDPRFVSNSSPQEILRDGEIEEYDLIISTTYHGCESTQPDQNGVYQIHEGHNSVLSFPGSLGDPESTDFLEVAIPALPDGYFSVISFGGTASTSDYFAYVPYMVGNYSIYDGYIHSGSGITVYIKFVDDRITESDETCSMNLGMPGPFAGANVTPYIFNEVCTSVYSKIIDNDGWKIGFVPADGVVGEKTILETNYGEVDYQLSRIDNGSNHGSDKHYPVDVKFSVSGTASSSDYKIFLNNANGSRTQITPDGSGTYSVRIQENNLYETITIQAQDDLIVERLEETLSLTITEAKGYPPFISYAYVSTPIDIIIRDNDKLELITVQYQDNLALVSDTIGSFGTNWQNEIHWRASNSALTLPVAYCSDDVMSCQVMVTGLLDPTQTYQVRMKWTYQSANTSNTVYSGWSTVSNSYANVDLGSSFISLFGYQGAYYDLQSSLEWEFRTTSEATRGVDGAMGSSVNPLYVTYKDPSNMTCSIYHSLVHISCVASKPVVGSDDQIFQALWNKISSKSITKVKLNNGVVEDDEILYYYGKDTTSTNNYNVLKGILSVTKLPSDIYVIDQTPSLAREKDAILSLNNLSSNAVSLLLYKDGTCDSWQDFAVNLCRVQGLACNKVSVSVLNTSQAPYNALKVNPSLTGQGEVVPRENTWAGHSLIQYNGNVYDPSYGLSYGSRNNFLASFISNLHSVGDEQAIQYQDYGLTYEVKLTGNSISNASFDISDDIQD